MGGNASLLLLAGGESRRMGRPKALLPAATGTLLEFVARRLGEDWAEVLVAAPATFPVPPALADARRVADRHPGAGPLAGIDAGLSAARTPLVLAVACDMPYVTLASAARLLAAAASREAAVPILEGRPEPLFAAYAKRAAPAIAAALEAGRYRARDVMESLDVAWLTDLEPDELRSLNTPSEYAAFLDALR